MTNFDNKLYKFKSGPFGIDLFCLSRVVGYKLKTARSPLWGDSPDVGLTFTYSAGGSSELMEWRNLRTGIESQVVKRRYGPVMCSNV